MSRSKTLIGISGRARAGKNTLAEIIEMSYGDVFDIHTCAFADPIKETVNALFGWDSRHADGELKEVVCPRVGVSPRHAYQTFGTEWGRNLIRDDIWTFAMEELVESLAMQRPAVVPFVCIIPDLRFPNELEWFRGMGDKGYSVKHIHVERPFFDNQIGTGHSSEGYTLQMKEASDVIIVNVGTLADLSKEFSLNLQQLG